VLQSIGLSEADKEKICHRNAQQLFGLASDKAPS
jgi:predicted TIM-barrel fold metal-dependent hydrolase